MIRLKNVASGYNGQAILKQINITFEKGTINTIIGKNGSGKTTLLRTASCLLKPFAGEILLNGQNMAGLSAKEIARQLSYLPQVRTIPGLSVYNFVMYGRFPYMGFSRIPAKKDRQAVEDALEKMGLTEYRNRNMHALSGGERHKASLAMTLAQDTDLVLLDEPTTYLDIHHQLEILKLIREMKSMGKTIIMVLHDLNNALMFSDKVCLMDRGEILLYSTPQEIVESRELERVFNISCKPVWNDETRMIHYLFSMSDQ